MSKMIERVIVSTDSAEIADIAVKYGAEVPFMRPSEFAQDDSGDFEWLKHLIDYLEKKESTSAKYLVHLRPTTPFRKVKIVENGIKYISENPNATSLRSVSTLSNPVQKLFKMEGPYLVGFFDNDLRPEYYNLPRQAFPQTYIPNGYVDIVKTSTLKKGLIHGDKMLGFITELVPDIDDERDFNNATKVLGEKRFDPLMKFVRENYE
jgi:CMP-N-acetylneuraminic acid synthetase